MEVRRKLVDKAVQFLKDTEGEFTVQLKMSFLTEKGLTVEEILEAMNEVTGGVLVENVLHN